MDDRLGINGFVSPHARKLLCLAGVSWSFAAAAQHLAEFCGLRTCDQTIRAVCDEEAGLLADWLHRDKAVGASFAAAAGDIEFQTDGTMVNTWDSWREMRLGIFAKRQRGAAATAQQWDSRRLPCPHARVLFAGIETAEHFGPRIRRWAGRLGIGQTAEISVLGDGADWIRHQTQQQLPGAPLLLDIYHALKHLADCAGVLYGEQEQAQRWVDAARQRLLQEGASGVQAYLAAERAAVRSPPKRAALAEVSGYFGRRADSLGYAERLALGQSIGSGLVEGACKQVIGRRMKQTGARWRIRRANRMATLCCTFHGDSWTPYWEHRLN